MCRRLEVRARAAGAGGCPQDPVLRAGELGGDVREVLQNLIDQDSNDGVGRQGPEGGGAVAGEDDVRP